MISRLAVLVTAPRIYHELNISKASLGHEHSERRNGFRDFTQLLVIRQS